MQEPRIDDIDLRLLAALQEDGRLTNFELAERAGLSASQCSRRRAALEESGIIEAYRASLSAEALGLRIIVFVQVRLAAHSPDNSRRFQKLIDGLDAVQEAYSLTGEADYLVKLIVPDLDSLSHILNEVLLPHGSVAQVRSSIVLDRLKHTTKLPLAATGAGATVRMATRPARDRARPRRTTSRRTAGQ